MKHRLARVLVALIACLSLGSALAGVSIKLGAVFPGWDVLRSGSLHAAATDLARDYSRQISHVCFSPEVFLRESSTSLITARIFYDGYLPVGASEHVLLDDFDQRVTLVSGRTVLSDVLSIMVVTRSGVVLILC
jgi:hypothetical protein